MAKFTQRTLFVKYYSIAFLTLPGIAGGLARELLIPSHFVEVFKCRLSSSPLWRTLKHSSAIYFPTSPSPFQRYGECEIVDLFSTLSVLQQPERFSLTLRPRTIYHDHYLHVNQKLSKLLMSHLLPFLVSYISDTSITDNILKLKILGEEIANRRWSYCSGVP